MRGWGSTAIPTPPLAHMVLLSHMASEARLLYSSFRGLITVIAELSRSRAYKTKVRIESDVTASLAQ